MDPRTPEDVAKNAQQIAEDSRRKAREKREEIFATALAKIKSRVEDHLADHPNATTVEISDDDFYREGRFYKLFEYPERLVETLMRQGFVAYFVKKGWWLWKKPWLRLSGWKPLPKQPSDGPYR